MSEGVSRPVPQGLDPQIQHRIETAAVKVFAEAEFHQVRLTEIAREARCSLQTLYRYYGSKEAVLNACLIHGLEQLAERMTDHLSGIASCRDRLSKVFWVVLDFFDKHPERGRMMIKSVYPGRWGADTTPAQQGLTALFLDVLASGQQAGVLNDQVSPEVLLDVFYGVLLRVAQMHLLRGRPGKMVDQHELLFSMLWRALTREEAVL